MPPLLGSLRSHEAAIATFTHSTFNHTLHSPCVTFSADRLQGSPFHVSDKETPNKASNSKARKKRGFFGKLRLLILWLILLVCIAIQAPVFPYVVRGVVNFEAWRNGVGVTIGAVEGTIFEPLVLRDTVWTYASPTGAATRLEARRVRGWFAWSNIFPAPVAGWIRNGAAQLGAEPLGGNGIWWQRLEIDGVSAKLALPAGAPVPAVSSAPWVDLRPGGDWLRMPLFFDLRDADVIMERGTEFIRASNLKFIASALEPGHLVAGQLTIKTTWFSKNFREVRGRTSLEGTRITAAGMTLAPELKVNTFSVELADLPMGKIAWETALDAFGGTLVAEAEIAPHDKDLGLSVNGRFANINLGSLSTFFGLSEAAGGVIREGTFIFHGSPRDITLGDSRLRLEADRVQWESRQWDTLVLGLSVVEQRLVIPECKLKQGSNELALSGTLAMPQPGAKWWELPFDLKIDASIRNLTELSALLLPEFTYTAGELFLRGSVSGSGAKPKTLPSYDGQLIVNGRGLKWRTAPLDHLTGALVFKGREAQIVNAQFDNDDDYLRANGTVSLDTGGFDGRVRASVRDLRLYGALLGPPIFPAPVAGSAAISWAGKWTDDQRKGDFTAKLGRFHLLGANATYPLDAELSGTVEREQLLFDKFKVSQNGTTLTAAVGVGPSLVNLSDIRLQKNGETWLEGAALLPLDLWQRWPDVNFTKLLNEDTVGRIQLTAKNLRLADASQLTGFEWPLGGLLNGTLTADGALKSIKLGGALQLTEAKIPLNWNGSTVTETNADFALDGNTITLTKAEGRHPEGTFTLTGTLLLGNLRAPQLNATGTGTRKEKPFTLKATGPAASAVITLEDVKAE